MHCPWLTAMRAEVGALVVESGERLADVIVIELQLRALKKAFRQRPRISLSNGHGQPIAKLAAKTTVWTVTLRLHGRRARRKPDGRDCWRAGIANGARWPWLAV